MTNENQLDKFEQMDAGISMTKMKSSHKEQVLQDRRLWRVVIEHYTQRNSTVKTGYVHCALLRKSINLLLPALSRHKIS